MSTWHFAIVTQTHRSMRSPWNRSPETAFDFFPYRRLTGCHPAVVLRVRPLVRRRSRSTTQSCQRNLRAGTCRKEILRYGRHRRARSSSMRGRGLSVENGREAPDSSTPAGKASRAHSRSRQDAAKSSDNSASVQSAGRSDGYATSTRPSSPASRSAAPNVRANVVGWIEPKTEHTARSTKIVPFSLLRSIVMEAASYIDSHAG